MAFDITGEYGLVGFMLIGLALTTAVDGQALEIKQAGIGHLGWCNILHGRKDGLNPAWMLLLPLLQHGLDILSLQIFLGTAEVTRNNRKLHDLGINGQYLFPGSKPGGESPRYGHRRSAVLAAWKTGGNRRTYSGT